MTHQTHIDEIIYVGLHSEPGIKGYLDIYSPRAAAAFNGDGLGSENRIIYACGPGVFENEIEFMLACKAKRNNTNFYMFEIPEKPDSANSLILQFDKNRHVEYNIVSGDRIPENMPVEKFKNVYKYMMQGVFIFRLMNLRGVGDFETVAGEGQIYTKPKKPHSFKKGDDAVLNVSNVFTGMLIDYYRISSGADGVDAQISFMRSAQYRIAVYTHMNDVFTSFVHMNTPGKEDSTDQYDCKTLCQKVVDILEARLNQ